MNTATAHSIARSFATQTIALLKHSAAAIMNSQLRKWNSACAQIAVPDLPDKAESWHSIPTNMKKDKFSNELKIYECQRGI